jgi:hypothetical protein
MNVTKEITREAEVKLTERDVSRYLKSEAMKRLGHPDTAGVDPMIIGNHVFGSEESRWHWGTDAEAVLYLKAAHAIRGWEDIEREASGWAVVDSGGEVIRMWPTRGKALEDAKRLRSNDDLPDGDVEVAALDLEGDPIIRSQRS